MTTCNRCGAPLTAAQIGRRARFCSDRCRKAAHRRRLAEVRAEEFRREYEAAYGPMPEGPADLAEVRRLLMTVVRLGSVQAAGILLNDLHRYPDEKEPTAGIIDELAAKRGQIR